MNPDGGFTRHYRRLWDNPAFRSKQEAAVLSWMIDTAQWRDRRMSTRFGPVDLRVGEVLVSERELSEDFGLHRNTLRALLRRMTDEGIIERIQDRCPQRAGTILRLRNYARYQGVAEPSEAHQDRNGTVARTAGGPQGDRNGTENNEGNSGKEGNDGTGSLRSPAVAAAPAGVTVEFQASLFAGEARVEPAKPAEVIDFRDEAERVRQQLWGEGKAIMRRLAPAMDPKLAASLIGQLAKHHGKGVRGGAKAIQVLRDVEASVAAGGIAGYAVAETPEARAEALVTYLQGAINRAKGGGSAPTDDAAPKAQTGAYAQARRETAERLARARARMAAGGGGVSIPPAAGRTIDGELA